MSAARQRSFSSDSRKAAYASISANFEKMFPDADRDDRLAWIAEYLKLDGLDSMTELTDDHLGAVAGEMKRLTGQRPSPEFRVPGSESGNVVKGNFGKPASGDGGGETVFLSSAELVYTIEKLLDHLRPHMDGESFMVKRFGTANARRLTFNRATKAVNALLHVAAHRVLKQRRGEGQKISRKEVEKHIPELKRLLRIDQ